MYSWNWAWGAYSYTFAFLIGTIMVADQMPKRPHYYWRLLASTIVLVVSVLAWQALVYTYFPSVLDYTDDWGLTLYIMQLLLMLGIVPFCYRCNFYSVLFCTTMGYAIQHIAERLYEILKSNCFPDIPLWGWFLALTAITAALYLPFYFLIIRPLDSEDFDSLVNKKTQVISSLVVLFVIVYLNTAILHAVSDSGKTKQVATISFLFSILCCILDIMYEVSTIRAKSALNEADRLQHLLNEERIHYEQEKANMELLNIKYHDIKHILNNSNGKSDPVAVNTAKKALAEYESIIQTGNPAINTVLTQKSKFCQDKGIRFSCFLDGQSLSYVDDYELYALFTNALDNAINASLLCPEDKRIISVSEAIKDDFAVIKIANYYTGKLSMKNGLPQTQGDAGYHGFGVKSIQLIAEKYDGRVSVMTQDDLFILQIFLPIHPVPKG
jgi:hypothetical protein